MWETFTLYPGYTFITAHVLWAIVVVEAVFIFVLVRRSS